jgi:hypothetical protein
VKITAKPCLVAHLAFEVGSTSKHALLSCENNVVIELNGPIPLSRGLRCGLRPFAFWDCGFEPRGGAWMSVSY